MSQSTSAATAASNTPRGRFVPDDFSVPHGFLTEEFLLEPLTAKHNAQDFAAWTSSIDHIKKTPGFQGRKWPYEGMPLEQNKSDLEMHARDFAARRGFTYTVLDPRSGDVVGCVYIYPDGDGPAAHIRSWVRFDRSELDRPLYQQVLRWIRQEWPFESYAYAPR